jgi:putative NADH-flavin reductase
VAVFAVPRKKLLVLGATGVTGQHVVAQALEQGHDVTVLVRDPQRLTSPVDKLRVLTGDSTDYEQVLGAVRGQDVVISSLGAGQSFKSHGVIGQSVPVILNAMENSAVRRLIFTSAYGMGATRRDTPLLARIFIRLLLRDIYADKEAGEKILLQSTLDWTIAYPTTLANGPRTGTYRVGERLALRGLPKISRADVADFLLTQVADTTLIRKGVLVSS